MTTVYKPLHTHHITSTSTNQFLSRQTHSLFSSGYREWCLAGRRGSRPWGKVLYGHTWLETPDPVRSPKLSNHRRVQYSGGGPPGKRTYCTALTTTCSKQFWSWSRGGPEAEEARDLALGLGLELLCFSHSGLPPVFSMSIQNSYPGRDDDVVSGRAPGLAALGECHK